MPALLASARVVVVSTSGREREGRDFTCPMKLLEAFAAERPVVATDLPSIRALADDEREALLFRDDDPKSLAAAIARLLEDPVLGAYLVATARARKLIAFLEDEARR